MRYASTNNRLTTTGGGTWMVYRQISSLRGYGRRQIHLGASSTAQSPQNVFSRSIAYPQALSF